jgi:hypothetical protein
MGGGRDIEREIDRESMGGGRNIEREKERGMGERERERREMCVRERYIGEDEGTDTNREIEGGDIGKEGEETSSKREGRWREGVIKSEGGRERLGRREAERGWERESERGGRKGSR